MAGQPSSTNKTADDAHYEKQRALFKGALYGTHRDLRPKLLTELEAALRAGPEEAIQKFITSNPYVLQYALRLTGNHGLWAFPKRVIRTQRIDRTPGLIPDYLVAARNSDGFTWHIVELKRFDTQFGNESGKSLSAAGLKAIVQCATYTQHFEDYIETIRSNVGVREVVTPKNVAILIGDSNLENKPQMARRQEMQRFAPRLDIVSYRRIVLRLYEEMLNRGIEVSESEAEFARRSATE